MGLDLFRLNYGCIINLLNNTLVGSASDIPLLPLNPRCYIRESFTSSGGGIAILGFSLNNLISFLLALFHLIEHKQDKAPGFIKTPFYFTSLHSS